AAYTSGIFDSQQLYDGIVVEAARGDSGGSARGRPSGRPSGPCRRGAAGAGGEEWGRRDVLGGVPGSGAGGGHGEGDGGDAHGEAAGWAQPQGSRPLATHGRQGRRCRLIDRSDPPVNSSGYGHMKGCPNKKKSIPGYKPSIILGLHM
uniref:Uncharacterized protein n=1 Tax=Triticum urartu TaxID=4572 RepID=A0A8R7QGQ2_TRIUA